MNAPVSPTRVYEACFVEMGKTQRMVQFYPITHPAFQRSMERSFLYLSQLLKRVGAFDLTISKTHLSIENRKITGNTKVLAYLSDEIFRRRIKQLHFDPATELKDYQALFRVLSMELPELQSRGGAEKTLAKSGARSIWANDLKFRATQIAEWEDEGEMDMVDDVDQAAGAETEEPDSAPPPLPAETQDVFSDPANQHPELAEHIDALIKAGRNPKLLVKHLNGVVKYCKQAATDGDHGPASSSLQVLSKLTYQFGENDKQMQWLIKAIRGIATKEVVKVEVSRIGHAVGSSWQEHANALLPVGSAVIPFLFQALADTDSRKSRRRLISTLHMFGDEIKEPSLKLLEDARWFVVRNAVDLLGGLKDPDVVPALIPLLKHGNDKVRMAARDALRQLGGEAAMNALIEATSHGDDSDRRHAVAQLTFFPAQQVLPKIIELVDKGSQPVAEESLRVLSELDPPDMMPYLEKILASKKGLFGSRKREALRRTAAELVCLRLPEAWPVLRDYASDSDMEVRKWVAKGVDMMQKSKRRGLF